MTESKWKATTIGELCDAYNGILQTGPFGSQLHAEDYVPNGPVPVVPTSAIGRRRIRRIEVPKISALKATELARHRLMEGDILFARRGVQATGLSCLVEAQHEGWLCGTGAILLRLPAGVVDAKFLCCVLAQETTVSWLRQNAIGATMPNLNEGVIRRLPLLLPPLSDQKVIAKILDALDDKIELNRKMNETLEEMARALFKSWFVDFDPVHAKAAGKKPYGMDDATAALFPDSFEESALGLIPRGWRVGTVEKCCSVLRRGIQPAYVEDEGVVAINQKCIREGRVSLEKARRHDIAVRSIAGRELEGGDVLVNSTGVGTLGRVAILPSDMAGAICDSHVTVARPDASVVEPAFFGAMMLHAQSTIESMGTGSTGQTELSREALVNLPTILPGRLCQARFSEEHATLLTMLRASEIESDSLIALRDTLLPKLLSGELRIKDAERLVCDVA